MWRVTPSFDLPASGSKVFDTADCSLAFCEQTLDAQACDNILSIAHQHRWESGQLDRISLYAADVRKCDNCFLYPNAQTEWIFHLLNAVFQRASIELGIPVGRIVEAPQVVRYQTGDHFDWHQDATAGARMRALTLSLQLTAPNAYTGGRLEIKGSLESPTDQGSICVFPAEELHRVTPITSGTRYALVAWIDKPAN
jgi:PKHD-type hydroxylase